MYVEIHNVPRLSVVRESIASLGSGVLSLVKRVFVPFSEILKRPAPSVPTHKSPALSWATDVAQAMFTLIKPCVAESFMYSKSLAFLGITNNPF